MTQIHILALQYSINNIEDFIIYLQEVENIFITNYVDAAKSTYCARRSQRMIAENQYGMEELCGSVFFPFFYVEWRFFFCEM